MSKLDSWDDDMMGEPVKGKPIKHIATERVMMVRVTIGGSTYLLTESEAQRLYDTLTRTLVRINE